MEIGRKIYFDNQTGNIIMTTGECTGDVIETTLEQDKSAFLPLQQVDDQYISCIKLNYGEYSGLIPTYVNPETQEIQWTNDTNIHNNVQPSVDNIDYLKQTKIGQMNMTCEDKIINDFHSDCLGELKQFDCTITDQLNIQGLVAKAQLMLQSPGSTDNILEWKATGEPICYSWTPQQVIKLGVDLYTHVSAKIKQFEKLRIYINDSNRTFEEVNSVTWNTVID